MSLLPASPGTTLSALRVAIGTTAWATPGLASKVFGLDAAGNPQAPYLARLFGIRDIALAAAAKRSSGSSRQLAWQIGIACDLFDVAAAELGRRDGTLPTRTAALAGGTALFAAVLGVAALQAGE